MIIAGRLPLYVLAITSFFVVNVSPSVAQKFLGYSRNRCDGEVKVPDYNRVVGARQSQAVAIKRDAQAPSGKVPIKWQCNDDPQRTVNCPAGTRKIVFDRTQGGILLTIICLKR